MKTIRMLGILSIFILLVAIPSVEASITLKTDKLIYNQGDTIVFTVKNTNNYSINFDGINIKNMKTGEITNTAAWCSPDPNVVCPAVVYGPTILDPGKTYITTWYLNDKGTYRSYIDWWFEPTAVCLAIGCPEPELEHSGRSYSNYLMIR